MNCKSQCLSVSEPYIVSTPAFKKRSSTGCIMLCWAKRFISFRVCQLQSKFWAVWHLNNVSILAPAVQGLTSTVVTSCTLLSILFSLKPMRKFLNFTTYLRLETEGCIKVVTEIFADEQYNFSFCSILHKTWVLIVHVYWSDTTFSVHSLTRERDIEDKIYKTFDFVMHVVQRNDFIFHRVQFTI